MKLLFIIIILFFSLSHVYAQTDSSTRIKKNSFSVALIDQPLSLMYNATNFNLGISRLIGNRVEIHLNGGFLKSFKSTTSEVVSFGFPTSTSTKGAVFSFEERYYLGKHKLFEPSILLFWLQLFQYNSVEQENTGYYIAFQQRYQYTNTERRETVLDFVDNNPFVNTNHYKTNDYIVLRNQGGGYFKFGYNAIKKSGFTVDYAVGIGITYISSSSENKLGNNNDKDGRFNKEFDNGFGFFFDLLYSFKIGWSF